MLRFRVAGPFLTMIFCAASLAAQATTPPVSAITVVSDDNYPPYVFRDASGGLQGIIVDQWKRWAEVTGVQVTLLGMDWSKAQRFMAEGRADVIDTIFQTRQRESLYDFTRPYASIGVPIFFHRSIGGISGVDSLAGFAVAVKEGDAAVEFLRDQGVSTLEEYPSYEAIIRAAAEQRVRVFCADEPPALYYLYRLGVAQEFRTTGPLYVGEFHRAVAKGRQDLLRLVESGFAAIPASEYRAIERRWMGSPLPADPRSLRYLFYALIAVGVCALLLLLWVWGLRKTVARRTRELRATVEALSRSEARYRLLAENAGDVIWTMDGEGRFTYVSPSVQKLRGFTPEEVIRQGMADALSPASRELVEALLARYRAALAGGEISIDPEPCEVEQPCRDGSTVWTEVVVTPLPDDRGSPQGFLGVSRDITERRRREEERRALEKHMLEAQKLESLGVLAGGIAHDFNNILTAILGNADLASEGLPRDSPARARIGEVILSSRRAAELCRQMLAYAGRGKFVIETLELSDLVREMVDMLQLSTPKAARLECHLDSGGAMVTADATQLRQVVMNLVINAAEALGKDGGVVTVSTGEILVGEGEQSSGYASGAPPPGRYATVEVADTGRGMDEETLRRIYEPFFTTKFSGRGLGLAAVLGIVRAHRGAIRVRSEEGKGTSVRVLLPAAEGAGPARVSVPPARDWTGEGKVLFADDEAGVRDVGAAMLERLGFRVLVAHDGREAVEMFRLHAEELVCCILDLTMPVMGGEDALREIRLLRPGAPVVVATGYSELDVESRFGDERPSGFIQKPYRLLDLAAVMKALLSPRDL